MKKIISDYDRKYRLYITSIVADYDAKDVKLVRSIDPFLQNKLFNVNKQWIKFRKKLLAFRQIVDIDPYNQDRHQHYVAEIKRQYDKLYNAVIFLKLQI